jgi:hypothetical protein
MKRNRAYRLARYFLVTKFSAGGLIMEQPNTVVTSATGKTGSELAQSQSTTNAPKTTGVLVLVTAKPGGVTREQVMKIMPAEIRATVRLYLDGAIRQWSRAGAARALSLSSTPMM